MIFRSIDLARQIAALDRPMDDETCDQCGSYEDFILNGSVELELPLLGAYVGLKCNKCKHEKYVGDSEFFNFHVMTEDGIQSVGESE